MQGAGSIYLATLQAYVINETELYVLLYIYTNAAMAIFYTVSSKRRFIVRNLDVIIGYRVVQPSFGETKNLK